MSKQLTELTDKTAMEIFTGKSGLDDYVQQVKDEVNNFNHDISTAASRARTISLASKVAKIKSRYDECGKDLVSGWKEQAKVVDKVRKKMRDDLDELKVIARKPVTDWEIEQQEIAQQKLEQEEAKALAIKYQADHEIGLLMNEKFDRDIQDKINQEILKAKEDARLTKEADEIYRLQLKEQAEEDARIAAQKIINDKEAEKQKAIDDKLQAERDLAAAEQARANQEWLAYISEAYQINDNLNAKAEQLRLDQIAEQRRLDDIESERLAGIQRQKEEQDRIRKENKARAEDKENKAKVNNAILMVLLSNGFTDKDSKKIITLAAKGLLPQLVINY